MTVLINGKIVNRVGIDLDGVIIDHFLGRRWVSVESTHRSGKRSTLYLVSEMIVNAVTSVFRYPVKDSYKVLLDLKKLGVSFTGVTSRQKHLKRLTLEWIKKHGFNSILDTVYFNEEYKSPSDHKSYVVQREKFDCFIDDDYIVCNNLNKLFPCMVVVNIGKRSDPNLLDKNIMHIDSWIQLAKIFSKD